jgi:hypothetical protein
VESGQLVGVTTAMLVKHITVAMVRAREGLVANCLVVQRLFLDQVISRRISGPDVFCLDSASLNERIGVALHIFTL